MRYADSSFGATPSCLRHPHPSKEKKKEEGKTPYKFADPQGIAKLPYSFYGKRGGGTIAWKSFKKDATERIVFPKQPKSSILPLWV